MIARTTEAMQLLLRVKHVASCTRACCCSMACNPTISAAGLARQSVWSPACSLYLHHANTYLHDPSNADTTTVRQAGEQAEASVSHLAV